MNRREFLFASAAAAIAATKGLTAPSTQSSAARFLTDIPPYPGNVLLARPTDQSVTLSLLSSTDQLVRVEYGRSGMPRSLRSAAVSLKAGEPSELMLKGLLNNTAYEYQVITAASGNPVFTNNASATFRTARAPGSSFTFTIQADSHLDDGCREDIYRTTLENQLADRPDFMVDLGDTSMVGKHPTRASALQQYAAQRYYFGLIGHSVPSYLVLGNHDGEEAKQRGATDKDGLAVWANRQRQRLLPNPVPDHFYSGNDEPHEHAGLLQNYYAWTWGDALLVVLDPYWTSSASRGGGAGWNMSLGRRQYDWLERTLRSSKSRHKLIFIHQLVGGLDSAGRGGAEAAALFEWGGSELDGRNTFAQHRPGWPTPIHQLLVDTKVTAVVHGHDHFYASQQKDGVHYVLAPQGAHRNFLNTHAQEYGYIQGDFLPNSGHLTVAVSPAQIEVQYVRAVPEVLRRANLKNRQILQTITLV